MRFHHTRNVKGVIVMETAWVGVLIPATINFYTDLRWRKIYNVITLPATVAGILYNLIYGTGIIFSLLGFAVMFGIGITGFAANGWGGGDAKMLIMVGAWVGWHTALLVMLAGAVIALLCFIARQPIESMQAIREQLIRIWLTVFWKAKGAWKGFKGIDQAPGTVPFGACLAVGSWLLMLIHKI